MASEIPIQAAPDSAVAAVVAPPERADEYSSKAHVRGSQSFARCANMRDFLHGYRAPISLVLV